MKLYDQKIPHTNIQILSTLYSPAFCNTVTLIISAYYPHCTNKLDFLVEKFIPFEVRFAPSCRF
jgi:hypothetical protein